jgi:peptidoglycan hydrolase CwlO-like protein
MKRKLLTLTLLIATNLMASENKDSNKSTNPFFKALAVETGAVVTANAEELNELEERDKEVDRKIADAEAKSRELDKKIADAKAEIEKGKAEEKRLDAQIVQIEKEIAELN